MKKIREYRPSDKDAIHVLIQSLQDHVAEMDPLMLNKYGPAFLVEEYIEYLVSRVARENGMIYIAEKENEIVGCIAGVVQDVQEDLETYASHDGKIMDLVIAPEHRGNHVGKELMSALERHFEIHRCVHVRVECFGYNQGGHAFYEKCGYHDRSVEMIKKLPA